MDREVAGLSGDVVQGNVERPIAVVFSKHGDRERASAGCGPAGPCPPDPLSEGIDRRLIRACVSPVRSTASTPSPHPTIRRRSTLDQTLFDLVIVTLRHLNGLGQGDSD